MNNPNIESNLNTLFQETPKEVETKVNLPSKGLFYNSPISDISLRPILFEDEVDLVKTIEAGRKEDFSDLILSKCLKGISAGDLVSMDKTAILLQLRVISLGSSYSVEHLCNRCDKNNELNVDLTKIPLKCVPDGSTDEREYDLEVLKKKVKVRYPRLREISHYKNSHEFLENLWRFVIELDGSDDKTFINSALRDPRFPLSDIHFLVKKISGTEYGVETELEYSCKSCARANKIIIPFSSDFFLIS